MKKIILKSLAVPLIVGGILVNFSSSDKNVKSDIGLDFIIQEATANGENCLKSSFVGRKAETGSSCFCSASNKFVTEQSCVPSGAGCSEISCS